MLSSLYRHAWCLIDLISCWLSLLFALEFSLQQMHAVIKWLAASVAVPRNTKIRQRQQHGLGQVPSRWRQTAQEQKKKEGNTLIFDTMLSSTRRRAALIQVEALLLMSELRRRRRCRRSCADARVNVAPVVHGCGLS
ncbi:hypothetical protein V8E52_003224 [Russula decolorans]